MTIVEYNHRIKQKPIGVNVPRRIAKHIAVLRPLVKKK